MAVIVLAASILLLLSGTQRITLPVLFEAGHPCVIVFGQRNTCRSDVGHLQDDSHCFSHHRSNIEVSPQLA